MSTLSRGQGVLCLGRIYADLAFAGLDAAPTLGREVYAQSFGISPGGGAVITAAQLVGLGRPAALLSRLGQDPLAAATAQSLEDLGVALTHVERAEDAGPQLTVAVVQNGDRAFITRRAPNGLPATLEAALDDLQYGHLHIGEYATLVEIPDVVTRAKAKGLTVSLDPSWDESLIRGDGLLASSQEVDLFMPNLEEAIALTGQSDPEAALDALSSAFGTVVLKCGADPARLAQGEARFSASAARVEVVDTIGAGDSFNAGFLHAWLQGAAPQTCLEAGLACGTASVQAAGGTGNLLR